MSRICVRRPASEDSTRSGFVRLVDASRQSATVKLVMNSISNEESNNPRHCRRHRPVRHHHTGSDATGSRTVPPRSQQPQDAEHESLLLEIAKINLESARENRESARDGREASRDNMKAARYGRQASRVRLWGSCLYLAAAVLAVALALGQAQPLAIADTAPQPASPPAVVSEQLAVAQSTADHEGRD